MIFLKPLSRMLAARSLFRVNGLARGLSLTSAMPVKVFNHHTKFADIHIVPMLEDNYGFIVVDKMTRISACVDPGDGAVMASALHQLDLNLDYIFCTHKHNDHVGGVKHLKQAFPNVMVIGTKYEEIPGIDGTVGEGDTFMFGFLPVQVMHTPCHTKGHISFLVMPPHVAPPPSTVTSSTAGFSSDSTYSAPDFTKVTIGSPIEAPKAGAGGLWENKLNHAPLLFCGDTLFVGGCGRFFEGTAQDMLANMDRFSSLPLRTNVFCAHEYTEGNIKFLESVVAGKVGAPHCAREEESPKSGKSVNITDCAVTEVVSMQEMIRQKYMEVFQRRANLQPTVPSTIEEELNYNLFMRCREKVTQELVGELTAEAAMARLRELKNNFRT